MATRSSTESTRRELIASPASSDSPTFLEGESKENAARKPLPALPQSPSSRAPGTPMSPVTLNIQSGDRPPQGLRGIIEGGQGEVQNPTSGRENSGHTNGDSSTLRTHDLPHRPSYTFQDSHHQQPQMAVISSTEDPDIRFSHGPSTNNAVSRHPERVNDELEEEPPPVPALQYHHQSALSEGSDARHPRGPYSNDIVDVGQSINRHLTPNSQPARGTPQPQRPASTYSDLGPNQLSPNARHARSPSWSGRAPSANSGRSNDARPLSYMDLTNMSYPQVPPAPLSLDNSQLRSVVGSHASLLSTQQTLEMYRQNIKKLNDHETQYAFAVFLVGAAQEAAAKQNGSVSQRKASPQSGSRDLDSPYIDKSTSTPAELYAEARQILQRLSDRGYPFAQYYLADGYASGLFTKNGESDNATAFPLFVSASKHGHAEAGYRAALCYEFGWGVRKDPAKALQFLRHSASKNHPGAMTRLGRACLHGDLGENKYREGIKWLKRGTEAADMQYNSAPFYLGELYEVGYGDDIFKDEAYAAQLFTQAADLGHAEAAYRMGDAYEHGKLCCPRDPALSVHFYTNAAERGHPLAMMALCAWYMIGAEPVLEKDENEAYEWARSAALCGLTKAEYAVGYFTEMGIGCRRDPLEANVWYVKAAAAGDERAKYRIAAINAAASGGTLTEGGPPAAKQVAGSGSKMKRLGGANDKMGQNEKDCIVM